MRAWRRTVGERRYVKWGMESCEGEKVGEMRENREEEKFHEMREDGEPCGREDR
jgi:hypothetical protein